MISQALRAVIDSVPADFASPAADFRAVQEAFLTPEWVRNRGREFTAGEVELHDPKVSPCYADLKGLPPLFLQVGQFDTMAPSTLRSAANATLAGVAVTVESWPGMIQGWHGLVGAGVPEAADAWVRIRDFIDSLP